MINKLVQDIYGLVTIIMKSGILSNHYRNHTHVYHCWMHKLNIHSNQPNC